MAAGAEAENTSFQAQAEDEGWIKAELYVPIPPLYRLFFKFITASNFVFAHVQCNLT